MRLTRFFLRYFPPSLMLEYEKQCPSDSELVAACGGEGDSRARSASGRRTKQKCVELSGLEAGSDVDSLSMELMRREPLLSGAQYDQLRQLVAKLRDKLKEQNKTYYYLHHVIDAHVLPLTHVTFNKSGSRFLTTSYDRTCRVWDTDTARQVHALRGHDNVVYTACYNYPTCALICTASFDRTCKIWDAQSGGDALTTLSGHGGEVVGVSFTPSSSQVLTASLDGTAAVWDTEYARLLHHLRGHSKEVVCMACDQQAGHTLLTGSFDGTCKLWDVRCGEMVRDLVGHQDEVGTCCMNYAGSQVASGSQDTDCKVWDVGSGGCVMTLARHMEEVYDVAYNLTGTALATGAGDGTARVWDVATGECVHILPHHATGSSHGHGHGCGNGNAGVTEASLGSYDVIRRGYEGTAPGGEVSRVVYNPGGSRLLTCGNDSKCMVWDTESGGRIEALTGHEDEVFCAAFNYTGDTIITASKDNTCRVWK